MTPFRWMPCSVIRRAAISIVAQTETTIGSAVIYCRNAGLARVRSPCERRQEVARGENAYQPPVVDDECGADVELAHLLGLKDVELLVLRHELEICAGRS